MPEPLTVKQAAESRHSVRKYKSDPIPDDVIRDMVRVAGLAPSPWNLQPWRLIAVKDQETKDKLMEAAYGQKQVGGSAVTFVLYTDMNDTMETVEETVHPGMADRLEEQARTIRETFEKMDRSSFHWWGRAQAYTFMGFLMLEAESRGYATSGMLGFDPAAVKKMFDLPDHVEIPALVAMGVPDEEGFPHHRHPVDRILKIIN